MLRAARFLVPALLAALFCASCGPIEVRRSRPRPNIDLPSSAKSLRLEIAPEVPDELHVPPRNGFASLDLHAWHYTLEYGFGSGFRDAFHLVRATPYDLAIQVAETEVELVAAAVSARYGVIAAGAQIRFKVRLLDANGQVVARSTHTVASPRTTTQPDEIDDVVAGAVEAMYETVAKDFFGPGAGGPASR